VACEVLFGKAARSLVCHRDGEWHDVIVLSVAVRDSHFIQVAS
jgi:hypothetical protein